MTYMNELLITHRGTIYPWQCDHMGHMNVMWYTGKFDEASWHLLAQFGLSRKFLLERNSALAAVQQNITYKRELHAGDTITIKSGFLEIKERIVRIFHRMFNDETGATAAVTFLTGVHMDAGSRRASPFPEEFMNRACPIIAGTDPQPGAPRRFAPTVPERMEQQRRRS